MTEPKTKAGRAARFAFYLKTANDWDAIAQAAIEAARPDVSGDERSARSYLYSLMGVLRLGTISDAQVAAFDETLTEVRAAAFAAGEAKGRSQAMRDTLDKVAAATKQLASDVQRTLDEPCEIEHLRVRLMSLTDAARRYLNNEPLEEGADSNLSVLETLLGSEP